MRAAADKKTPAGRPAYRDPMALEGEAELGAPVGGNRLVASCRRLRLRLGGLFAEVLDAYATLDGPDREPLLVWEDRYASEGCRQARPTVTAKLNSGQVRIRSRVAPNGVDIRPQQQQQQHRIAEQSMSRRAQQTAWRTALQRNSCSVHRTWSDIAGGSRSLFAAPVRSSIGPGCRRKSAKDTRGVETVVKGAGGSSGGLGPKGIQRLPAHLMKKKAVTSFFPYTLFRVRYVIL